MAIRTGNTRSQSSAPLNSDFEVMRHRIHAAAAMSGVDPAMAEQIAQPRRVIEMNLVVVMDDGRREIFPAWAALHSSTRAIEGMKGGIKIAMVPGADRNSVEAKNAMRDAVTALAAGMTIKTTVTGLPLGGAKGAIIADVHSLSAGEKERLIRRYASEIAVNLGQAGEWQWVPAPDMGTTPNDMAVFADTISRIHGGFTPGVVTGKPVSLGGIPGRVEATGFGVSHIADAHQSLDGRRVVISGFGNVGSFAAVTAVERGAKVVALHDPFLGGVLVDDNGIDIAALMAQFETLGRNKEAFQTFVDAHPSTEISIEPLQDILPQADVYMPCAAPQSVDLWLASALCDAGVDLVVEGANSPIQPEAVAVLDRGNVTVIPDVLANAGGVTCSFLEMSKAASMTLPSQEETLARVGDILTVAYNRVREYAAECGSTDLRLVADALAVKEIAEAHHLRGIY